MHDLWAGLAVASKGLCICSHFFRSSEKLLIMCRKVLYNHRLALIKRVFAERADNNCIVRVIIKGIHSKSRKTGETALSLLRKLLTSLE